MTPEPQYYPIESNIPVPEDVEIDERPIERLIEHPIRYFQHLVELSTN